MRVIIKFIFKIIAIIMYRPKVIGKQNIPKDEEGIICPNHVHPLDSAIIIAMNKRKINVLAKEELFKTRIEKWFAKVFGIYPLKRGKADIDAIKTSFKILKSKELLMIFPEGTRNGLKKGIKPKNGAIVIAIKTGAPIIPVGVQGSFKLFTKVIVNIGKPIYYNQYKDKIKDKEVLDKLTEELIKEIIKLRECKKECH